LTTFFVDSSALGRRYLTEIGSAWVQSWMAPSAGHVTVISNLAPVEMFAAFARLQRDGTLASGAVGVLQTTLLVHVEKEYLNIALDGPVLVQARLLVSKYVLRTLDALQLACALAAVATLKEPMTFVTGDNRLLRAATAEGFTTDNPYWHP
jgi:uncharacterized protein